MKQFTVFVRKEFCHIFRDKRTMLILLVMPVVLIVLFGFAITNEVKDTRLSIIDKSKDHITRRIIDRFEANRYFTVSHDMADAGLSDAAFKRGEVNMVMVFGEDFASRTMHTGDAAVQLIVDGSEPNQASVRTVYAQMLLMSCLRDALADRGMAADRGGVTIVPEMRMLYNPQQRSEFNFVPNVIGMILLLICAMMSSIAIVREKEQGTMEVLLASPLPPFYIVLAKAVPYFVISSADLVMILLLSAFLLGIPIAGSLVTLTLMSLMYIFTALSLGLLISTLVKSQMAAMLLSGMVLMIPTLLMSGTMFPIESMPLPMQRVSMVIPARWFTEAVRKLMIQGTEVRYVLKEFAIIALMIAAFLSLACRLFKTRLE